MLDAGYQIPDIGGKVMRNLKSMYRLDTRLKTVLRFASCVLCLVSHLGCAGNTPLVKFVKEGGLEAKGLINLALASSGARVVVSQDNPDHPASTLINGITTSDNWGQGEGWELKYEGRFARGGYLGYGVEDPMVATERGLDESFDPGNPTWRGLRVQTRWGGSENTALGWVIIELPEEKTVNRAVVYTIDSITYPAEKFGVRDLMLQYWSDSANSWIVVDRLGKAKGQAGNTIQDNKSGVITLRFQPVRTSRMRFVVRWTNDSKNYSRGYYTYASGTIRLVEIEIYGYEKKAEEEEPASAAVVQDANKIAEIQVVIDNYADGYNRRNVDMLMSSISPDYSKNGETYSGLKKRMESIFAKYGRVKLELQNVEVRLTDKGATGISTYTAEYVEQAASLLEATADESPPTIVSGVLSFELSDATGHWKITRIDSEISH
jgi:hypothetical protein